MNSELMYGIHPPSLIQILYHIANGLAFFSFLLRDQLRLRSLLCVSFILQAVYYYVIPNGPIYDALFWKIVTIAANLGMIFLVFGSSIDFGIPDELRKLYHRIHVLAPGQFRRLIANAARTKNGGQTILVEGQKPEQLFYLLKGSARLVKAGQASELNDHIFLGEIAFLADGPASATVTLSSDAECIVWNVDELHKLMKADAAIDIAIRGLFNRDLAAKVASSMPYNTEPSKALLKQA